VVLSLSVERTDNPIRLSRMNLSEYVGHVTVFRRMYTIEVLHSSRDRVTISVKIRVTC